MSISNSGLLTWTPQSAGQNAVTVLVNDGRGGTATQNFTLIALANAPNHAPVFQSTPPATAFAGEPFQYQAVAVDPDGDPVTYSFSVTSGSSTHPRE